MALQQRVSLARFGVSPQVESLVLWRDPKQSGAVLGAATAAYYFLQTTSLIILALYSLAGVVAVGLVWQQGGNLLGRSGPRVPSILEGFSEESWNKITTSARPHVNLVLNSLGALVGGRDVFLSLKVLGASLAAAYVLRYVSLLTLGYTVVVLAFVLPKVYELRKDDCDRVLVQVEAKVKEVYGKVEDLFLKKHKPAMKVD